MSESTPYTNYEINSCLLAYNGAMIQMTVKRLDLGGPEWEIAGARDEVVASQGNVTCGN